VSKAAIATLTAAVLLGLSAIRQSDLWWFRTQTLSAAETRAANLSSILSEYMRETFGAADASLRQLALHPVCAALDVLDASQQADRILDEILLVGAQQQLLGGPDPPQLHGLVDGEHQQQQRQPAGDAGDHEGGICGGHRLKVI